MKKLFLSLFAVCTLLSCSSDDSSPVNNGVNENVFITFKANGTTYTMDDPYSITSMKFRVGADQGLNDDYRGIAIWMPLEYTVGTHPLVDAPSDLDAYEAKYSEGSNGIFPSSGTLTISSISEDYVEGTFNFTGEDIDGNTYNITEGSFRADR